MLKNLPFLVKFVYGGAIKSTMTLPWHSRDTMNSPANHYNILHGLPYTTDVNPQGLEKYSAIESKGPEDRLIVLNTHKSIKRIFKHNIIPVEYGAKH